jgi:hypothetical protein
MMRLQQQQLQQRDLAFRDGRGGSRSAPKHAVYTHEPTGVVGGGGVGGGGRGGAGSVGYKISAAAAPAAVSQPPLKSLFPNPAVASVISTTADDRAGSHPPWESGLRKSGSTRGEAAPGGPLLRGGGSKMRGKTRKQSVV